MDDELRMCLLVLMLIAPLLAAAAEGKRLTTTLLLYVASLEGCGIAPAMKRARRTINGKDVRPNQFPWMLSIQVDEEHICGGALIREDFVLTAAHCVVDEDNVTIVAGLHSLSDVGIRVNVTSLIHPMFNYSTGDYDMALLRLHTPLTVGVKVQPICLPSRSDELKTGDSVSIAGWGRESTLWDVLEQISSGVPTHKGGARPDDSTDELRSRKLKLVSSQIENVTTCSNELLEYSHVVAEACQRGDFHPIWCKHVMAEIDAIVGGTLLRKSADGNSAEKRPNMSSSLICAVSSTHDGERCSPCHGDSGGPLMVQAPDGSWSVVGVASRVPSDCIVRLQSYPQSAFYTTVRASLDWIRWSMDAENSTVGKDAYDPKTNPGVEPEGNYVDSAFTFIEMIMATLLGI